MFILKIFPFVGLLDAAKESDKDYSRSVPPNATNSLNFYKKACDEGNLAEACHRYSAFFIRGMKNVCQKNMEEAFKYSLKGKIIKYIFIYKGSD